MNYHKGSEFEREICRILSRWWTSGERDDVFWRSSQSGGRATQRAKVNLTTYGSYGDITALDPIGAPLLRLFTIELKRGDSHGFAGDLMDFTKDRSHHPFLKCLAQAIRSHGQAKSISWMLISKRDRRRALVHVESSIIKSLLGWKKPSTPIALVSCPPYDFAMMGLEDFLVEVPPSKIIEKLNEYEH